MDLGGFNWSLLTIVGVVVLAAAILWAMLRNRSSARGIDESERATRRLYEEEDREHHAESDEGP